MNKARIPSLSLRSKVVRGAAIAGLAAAAIVSAAPGASASGTSSKTYGCWSTWGDTGSNAHCQKIEKSGYFANKGYCDWSSDQTSGHDWKDAGTSDPDWGQIDCTFHISRSLVEWSEG